MLPTGTNIFILEDDSLQQYSLKRTLESLGYRVVGCTASAQEALESLKALQETPGERPSILLVDIRLRGPVDGIEFVASLPPELKVPHIFITAFNDEQHFSRSILTNPAGYLLKPFGKLALDYQIRLALRNQENEVQLLEKTALLESFLSGSEDGIILIDKEGRILEWSKSSERIFGISRERALSCIAKELDRSLSILQQNKNSSLLEVKRETAEGVQHLQITRFPVGWKNDAYTCFIVRDVTFLKQAEESILQANRELSILNQVLAAIGKSFHLEEVLPEVLQILTEGLQASGGVLYLFDESSGTLHLSCSRGISPRLQTHLTPIKLGETILGQIAQSDYTLGIDNLSLEPNRLPPEAYQDGWQSLLAVPIKRESKLFGLIALFSTEKQSFNPSASRLLTTIAHELSISLENTLLYQKTKKINIELERKVAERTQDLNTLAELSRELTFILGYRELFTVLFSLLRKTSSFAAAAVCFRQESSLVVFLHYGSPVSEEFDGRFREKIEDYVLSVTDNQVLLKPEMFFALNERLFPPETENPPVKLLGEMHVESFEQRGDLYSHKGFLFFTTQGKQKFQDRERHLFRIAAQQTTLMLQALEYRLGIEKKRLEQVVANLPEGLWIVDRNGTILVQNPQALEFIQKTTSKEQIPSLLETIRTLPGGEKTLLEVATPSKQYLSITAELIDSGPDAGGKIVLLRDLTEERLKDEQIKVQERLAAVGQLASGIAHDFNNILTGIIGYCEYLQLRKDVGSEIRVYLLKPESV